MLRLLKLSPDLFGGNLGDELSCFESLSLPDGQADDSPTDLRSHCRLIPLDPAARPKDPGRSFLSSAEVDPDAEGATTTRPKTPITRRPFFSPCLIRPLRKRPF